MNEILGKDLCNCENLTKSLVELICERHVHWRRSIAVDNLTHIVDFGPGGVSGIGGLTFRNTEGTGVQIVIAGAFDGNNHYLSYKPDMFDSDISSITYSKNWGKDFQPKLVRTAG